jgi:hypothetical protein
MLYRTLNINKKMKRYKMKKLKKNIALVSALAAGTIVAGGTTTAIVNSELSQQQDVGTFAAGSLSVTVNSATYKEIDITYNYKAKTGKNPIQTV